MTGPDEGHCGDWLLLPEQLEPPPPRRSGDWREIFRGAGHALFAAPPTAGWRGAPWRQVELGGGGRAWLLGEPRAGDASSQDERIREVARGGDPARLGPRFLLLVFDPASRDFELVTDRHGTFHAYAAELATPAEGRAASTSFATLAPFSRRRLDWTALAGFFAFGFFLGRRTFYDDVRCLEPARRHRLLGGGAERYWRWRHEVERGRSHDDTVHDFAEVFEKIVAEAAGGSGGGSGKSRVAVPISGGLDSRALLAACPAGADAWGFTYGYQPGSIEIRLARRLARRRGLPWQAYVVEPYLDRRLGQVLETVEGFQDVTQTRQVFVTDQLAAHADTVLAGHWGDVWLDDMGLFGAEPDPDQVSDEAVLRHTLGRLRKRGRRWLLEHLCLPRLEDDPERLLEAEVGEALAGYGHLEDPDFRVKAFKTDHWSWRWTLASVRAYQSAVFPRLPFYDPRLGDFLATVPTSSVAGRRLELDYLLSRAGDLARVPWQETGAGLATSRRRAWWLTLPRRAAAKALRTLGRRPVIERNWQVQLLGEGGRQLLDDHLLRPGLRLHDLVDPAEVRALVEDFRARPGADSGYTVSMLLTFAAWLEAA